MKTCTKQKDSRDGRCKIHSVAAYSDKYDAFFCPVTNQWLEPECKCSEADYAAGECHVPKPRPATAEGLKHDFYAKQLKGI